jgi:RecA-family ATPase
LSRIFNGIVTQEDKEIINIALNEERFKSRLTAFSSTKGLRPGELSVVVGPSGNGKSTLCKTISIENAINGIKCFHLLSEEKTEVYKGGIAQVFEKMTGGKNTDKFLQNLLFETMLDWDEKEENLEYLFSYLEEVINTHLPEMIIFDNFTTSFIGDLHISQQGVAINRLRKLASSYDIAIVGVFHTAKGSDLYTKILDGDSVRGHASSTNKGSYNYILSTFFRLKEPRAILFLHKTRYHKDTMQTYWDLFFDKELGIYTSSKKVSYEDVKNIMEEATFKKKKTKKEYSNWN